LPFLNAKDSNLPKHIKKLPFHQREVFVAAFNSAYESKKQELTEAGKSAANAHTEAESYAFPVATAAANKAAAKKETTKVLEKQITFKTDFSIPIFKAWQSDTGKKYISMIASSDTLDKTRERVTQEFIDAMKAQALAGEIELLETHDSVLPIGKSVNYQEGGEVWEEIKDKVKASGPDAMFIPIFELIEERDVARQLYKEVTENKRQFGSSIGGRAIAKMKHEEGVGMIKLLYPASDKPLDHVATTRKGRACNPDTEGMPFAAVMKSIDWENDSPEAEIKEKDMANEATTEVVEEKTEEVAAEVAETPAVEPTPTEPEPSENSSELIDQLKQLNANLAALAEKTAEPEPAVTDEPKAEENAEPEANPEAETPAATEVEATEPETPEQEAESDKVAAMSVDEMQSMMAEMKGMMAQMKEMMAQAHGKAEGDEKHEAHPKKTEEAAPVAVEPEKSVSEAERDAIKEQFPGIRDLAMKLFALTGDTPETAAQKTIFAELSDIKEKLAAFGEQPVTANAPVRGTTKGVAKSEREFAQNDGSEKPGQTVDELKAKWSAELKEAELAGDSIKAFDLRDRLKKLYAGIMAHGIADSPVDEFPQDLISK
jgi:cation transport regulator ChaB